MAVQSGFAWDESMKAASDLSAKQYYCMELTGKNLVDVCNAAADRAIGVLQNDPKSGQAASVRLLGTTKVVSDGSGTAITAGDLVGPNNAGKVVKKATADYSVLGIANDASSADGIVIEVFIIPLPVFRTLGG